MKTSEDNKLLNSTIEYIYSEGNKIKKYIDKVYEIYNAGGSAIDYWKETKEEADKFYETFDIIKKDIEQLDNDKLNDFHTKYKGLLSMSMAVGGDSIRGKYDTLCAEFEQTYKDLKENNN